jgi:hypothetical protein
MQARTRMMMVAVTLSGVVACSQSAPSANDALRRDLELARGQGLELAPRGAGQATVSAVELVPQGTRAPSSSESSQRAKAPAPSAKPAAVAEAPAAEPAESPAATTAPATQRPVSTRPAVNPPPPGGYKTMGELIRKAPFPINP